MNASVIRGSHDAGRRRLLMVCSTVAEGSGMMAAVAPLARQLARRGFGVHVVGPVGSQEKTLGEDQTEGMRLEVWRRGRSCPRPLIDALTVASRLEGPSREGRPSVVHVHGVWAAVNVAACMQSRRRGVPYVVSPHGMLLPAALRRSWWKKRLALAAVVRRNLEAAAAVHVSSEAERDSVRAVAPAAHTVVIPWGVSESGVLRDRRQTLSGRCAAYVGRILPIKGVDDLVAAWANVRPSGWKLKFVGSDPEGHVEQLVASIEAHGLEESVTVHPAFSPENLTKLFNEIDLLILPSHSENFGLVVAEALVAGVPVITTTAAPWADIPARRCGWWVPDNPSSLTEALEQACALPADELKDMGSRGQEWMRESFAWPAIASRFETELYQPTQ